MIGAGLRHATADLFYSGGIYTHESQIKICCLLSAVYRQSAICCLLSAIYRNVSAISFSTCSCIILAASSAVTDPFITN